MGRKIFQLLPCITKGDAISNDAIRMHELLARNGYDVETRGQYVIRRIMEDYPFLTKLGSMPELSEDDVLLYHLSTGSPLHREIRRLKCKKIFVYHNITPAEFYKGYSAQAQVDCRKGISEVIDMKDQPDLVLADSAFNGEDLRRYGYTCPIVTLPILLDFSDFTKEPDPAVMERFHRGEGHNIVFVGRVVPNKRHQDLIAAFAAYRRKYDPEARLFLVGGCIGLEHYVDELKLYAKRLGVEDGVYLTGHVRFPEILAYYQAADAFLSLSQHEGFCVPLMEAMYFDLPVLALARGAVPETMGDAGVLLQSADPETVADALSKVLHMGAEEKAKLLAGQKERLEHFAYEHVAAQFLSEMQRFMKEQ